MGFEDGKHHGEAAGIPADHGPARRAERGRRHQRLDFHQQRARALDAGEHGVDVTGVIAREGETDAVPAGRCRPAGVERVDRLDGVEHQPTAVG